MAVLSKEGTLRGYGTRCAEVTQALQSVKVLVGSQHAVCFGLGDGSEHIKFKKVTVEVKHMRDGGVNYLQDLLIVLPEQIERVATELAALQLNLAEAEDFGRQGR